MVKKRYFEIINLVINSNDEITVKDISNLYNITERSIRYDIDTSFSHRLSKSFKGSSR